MNPTYILVAVSALLLLTNILLLVRYVSYRKYIKRNEEDFNLLQQSRDDNLAISETVLELNAVIRAAGPDIKSFLETSLIAIAEKLESNCGCVYVLQDNKLKMEACYAVDPDRDCNQLLEIGESLAGQAFSEEKPFTVQNLPANYLKISSGMGSAVPADLLFIPLQFNQERPGVIELAAFKPYDEKSLAVAESISESFAAKLISIQKEELRKLMLRESEEKATALAEKERELERSLNAVKILQEKEEQTRHIGEQRLKMQIAEQEELMKKTLNQFEQKEKVLQQKIRELESRIS